MTGVVVGLGVFDGVHLGHQRLLKRVVDLAREKGLKSMALTFHPHPASVLDPGGGPPLITSIEKRRELLLKTGVQEVRLYPFTLEFASLTSEDFVRQVLKADLHASIVVVGFNYAFGRGGQGNVDTLKEFGREYGFEVDVVEPVIYNGQVVGSTEIRRRILNGDVEGASLLLGRNFSLSGKVVAGAGRGRTLGYPTANLAVGGDLISPADGVYAVIVRVRERTRYGLANIGYNPTFQGCRRGIEVFILDFDEKIYDAEVEIEFMKKIREERKFPGAEDLKAQIADDIFVLKGIISRHEAGNCPI